MESKHYPAVPVNRTRTAGETPPGGGTAAPSTPAPAAAPPPAAPPPILSGMPTYWHLLAAFRRRWCLATSLGLLVGAAAAVVTYFLASPLSYKGEVLLHVESSNPKIVFNNADGRGMFETYQRNQIGMIKSRVVLNAALRDAKVAQLPVVREQPDPITWLQKQVQADFSQSPEILQISINGKDPDSVQALVEAIRDAYLSVVVNAEQNQRYVHLEKLEKLYTDYADSLQKRRKILRENGEQLLVNDPKVAARRQEFLLKELSTVQTQLLNLKPDLVRAQLELEQIKEDQKALEAAQVPDDVLDEVLSRDPAVVAAQKDVVAAEELVEKWKGTAKAPDTHAKYLQAKKDLAAAQQKVEDTRKERRPALEAAARVQQQRKLQGDLARKQAEVARMQRLEEVLRNNFETMNAGLKDGNKKVADFNDLTDEIEVAAALVKKIGNEKEALKIENQASPRVTQMGDSYVVKQESMALKYGAGAGAAGFLVVVLGIALLEFFSRRVNTVADVSGGLRLPVVGTLPLLNARGSGVLGSGSAAAQQLLIESVDAARTVLLHAFRKKNLRIAMISSAGAGEGKTMLSAHLAASVARAGWRVLLIDGDMRCPSLHKVFGVPGDVGLGEALRGAADLREIVQAGPLPGLWVVPAGNADTQTMRSLAQGGLALLLAEIKNEYDFILVDSAPILPVVDSQLMAQAVDGVILSVLQNVSRLPAVYAAYERLMIFQVDVLGVVVHGTAAATYGNNYTYLPFPARATAEKKAE